MKPKKLLCVILTILLFTVQISGVYANNCKKDSDIKEIVKVKVKDSKEVKQDDNRIKLLKSKEKKDISFKFEKP